MRTPRKRPVAIDLYSGAGGLSLGLEQAGFDIALAVERDPYHAATHHRNFPYGKTLCESVDLLDGKRILEQLPAETEVSLICGGPPCQGFSSMGKRYKHDPRNTLVDHFVRVVLDIKPKAFLMENVPGMQSGDTATIYQRAIDELKKSYTLTDPVKTINAADFGVPQRRNRLFVVGVRSDLGVAVKYPSGPCSEQVARPTVWEAIGDLPALVGREGLFKSDESPYKTNDGRSIHPFAKVARGLRVDLCDYSHPRKWNNAVCTGCRRIRHRPDIEALYAATPHGGSVPAHNLPKLDPKGLAPTLRAGTDSEHGSYNAPRPIHPVEPRCITVREAARLHGYPDWFRFHPTKWHAHRQIGNSVCPPVARALGSAILQALGVEPIRPENVLEMSDDFSVPKDHRKHHTRIKQLTEWPKVVEELLKQAGPTTSGAVKRPDFSTSDVKAAGSKTGALMQRTPPDRFLEDIARSRNRRELLKPALTAGFTIKIVNDGEIYGRFVPIGTPGSIDDRDPLSISSAELAGAQRLVVEGGKLNGNIARMLEIESVTRALFEKGKLSLDFKKTEVGTARSARALFTLKNGKRQLRHGVVVTTVTKLPSLSSIRAVLDRTGLKNAIVLTPLTKRHFAAVVARILKNRPAESARAVFEIEPQDKKH